MRNRLLVAVAVLSSTAVFAQETVPSAASSDGTFVYPSSARDSADHSPATADHEWTDRGNHRYAPNLRGGVGLLRTSAADLGREGVVRIGLSGQYAFSADFPVRGVSTQRTLGAGTLSFVPLKFLEIAGAFGVGDITNNRVSPVATQYLGNLSLGAKLAGEVGGGFFLGVELLGERQGRLTGRIGRDSAYSAQAGLIATWDLREASEGVLPVVAHANVGYRADRRRGTDAAADLNASQDFVYNLNRFNRVVGNLGVEIPLPVLTPFAEFHLEHALNVPGPGLVTPDGRVLSGISTSPMSLAAGVRLTAVRDLTLTAAAEFAMNNEVVLGIPAGAPWNVLLAAAYNFDPMGGTSSGRSSAPVETPVPQTLPVSPPPPAQKSQAQVTGIVIDGLTQEPLGDAILTIAGSDLPPVASEPGTGRFLTQGVPPGNVRLMARRSGYKDGVYDLTVQRGEVPNLQVALSPLPRESKLTVAALFAGKPVESATVKIQGPMTQAVQLDGEPVTLDAPRGRYSVTIEAPGYLSQIRELELSDVAPATVAFDLVKEPKKKLVTVTDEKLEISQQIRFATGRTVVLDSNRALLDQIVDAILKSNIKKLRIEGHTDNRGDKDANLALSEERARAVAQYLVSKGISADAVESAGFGDTRPVAPNLTARGRELNRRVDFVIVER